MTAAVSMPGESRRTALDPNAMAWMLLLTLVWALQQIAIKLALPGVSPIMQSGLRSLLALLLLIPFCRLRGISLFDRDGTLLPGLAAGALFAAEFAAIYFGLEHTSASRMVVFLYIAPILTALGLALAVPGETLSVRQWFGALLSFAGIVVAFADGFARGGNWLGDACGMFGALLWAATTVLIRRSSLSNARAEKTLFYQLAVSAAASPLLSRAFGESGITRIDPIVVSSLLGQGVVVAFASYLVWFWLLTRYLASRLAVFTFLTPLFGVLFGVVLLHEQLTPAFGLAALLSGAGIVLVNFRS